ncbi:MAG: diphosphate--fructose-6-phosphate 1-phosphotransferase [Chlamydiae bacterium]|nr:diphosphate--fructose-6-phosphate 1-phosphotransferase [Chlamydiota bacterium]
MNSNILQKYRQEYKPLVPNILKDLFSVTLVKGEATAPEKDVEEVKKLFPRTFGQPVIAGKAENKKSSTSQSLRVGVVFSGGQAAGGHNVICGLLDALKTFNKESTLFGFLEGPGGIVAGKYKEITLETLSAYRNQGGFDLIGSGRTKIETTEQLEAARKICNELKLDGLVIIGGDDSNTNAAILAEFFLQNDCKTRVIGVPKTIDGDLKNSFIDISFGFDTASKVYSEMIGNIERDALSAKKYYHFIKLMGRSASHIALECALSTCPNITIIGEEVSHKKQTLSSLVNEIANVVAQRAEKGKNYGVILVPEGLIEFIPEIHVLISELNRLPGLSSEEAPKKLSEAAKNCFLSLPVDIQKQLLLDRDPHGNVQVSLIETERLLMEKVSQELEARKQKGTYKGKFSALNHFLGYEGRCSYPSNFDAHYCYSLGLTATLLILSGFTGYMAYVKNLAGPIENWEIGGVPTTMFLNIEERKGKRKPVIEKALVELDGQAFAFFAKQRKKWEIEDCYAYPGPIQFFGERSLTDVVPISLTLEAKKH